MKKAFIVFVLLFTTVFIFAMNDQKIWSVNDDIYSSIESLYLQQGLASPSATGPWSTAELKLMLSKVKDDGSPLYEYVYNKLYDAKETKADSYFDFKFNYNAAVTGYFHSNKDFKLKYASEQIYTEDSNYIFKTKYSNRRPTFMFDLETWAGNSFYGYVSYQFQNENFINDFDSYNFNFDIAWLTRDGLTSLITQAPPFRAFVAAGGEYWSLELGREQLSWGSGSSGNLILSNNIPYHNVLRAAFFGERFKYTFAISFFTHPMMDSTRNYSIDSDRTGGQKGIYYYMAHRLESRFFKDKLSVCLTESIVYQSEYSLDPRFLIPSAVFHNYFIKSNANSIVGIEANYTFNKYISVYGQVAIDDIASPIEASEGDTTPTALGFMLGAKSSLNYKEGVFSINLEGVYTQPYLYHRSKSGGTQGETEYGLNYIAIYRSLDSYCYPRYYLGYVYGGDALACDLKVKYEKKNNFSAEAEAFAMSHGSKWIDSLFEMKSELATPSGDSIFTGYLKLSGSYYITDKIQAFANIYLVRNNGQGDVQCTAGITVN